MAYFFGEIDYYLCNFPCCPDAPSPCSMRNVGLRVLHIHRCIVSGFRSISAFSMPRRGSQGAAESPLSFGYQKTQGHWDPLGWSVCTIASCFLISRKEQGPGMRWKSPFVAELRDWLWNQVGSGKSRCHPGWPVFWVMTPHPNLPSVPWELEIQRHKAKAPGKPCTVWSRQISPQLHLRFRKEEVYIRTPWTGWNQRSHLVTLTPIPRKCKFNRKPWKLSLNFSVKTVYK